jgi:hypothetical protein
MGRRQGNGHGGEVRGIAHSGAFTTSAGAQQLLKIGRTVADFKIGQGHGRCMVTISGHGNALNRCTVDKGFRQGLGWVRQA